MSRDPIWDALKEVSKERRDQRRQENLEHADQIDDGKWVKHNKWHWTRPVQGHKLQYWPSKKKWEYRGKVMSGDIVSWLAKNDTQRTL